MEANEYLDWQDKTVTSKQGILRGRQARVTHVDVFTTKKGERIFINIEYLDNGRPVYGCNPENYELWTEYSKYAHVPKENIYGWFEKILKWQDENGIQIGLNTYVIIRAEKKVPFLVLQSLMELNFLVRIGSIKEVLKANGITYKNFAKEQNRQWGFAPHASSMLYQATRPE